MATHSETVGKIAGALAKLHTLTSGAAAKGGTNPHFRSSYTRLEDAWAVVAPHMEACGLGFVQFALGRDDSGAFVAVDSMLCHESGEWLRGETRVRVDDRQTGAQADGSALTYARRYAMLGMLGLAPSDDDGEAASPKDAGPTPEARPSAKSHLASLASKEWTFPSGEHKGKTVRDVPTAYLTDLVAKLPEGKRERFEDEIERRINAPVTP